MTDFDSTDDWTEPADDEIRAIRDYFDRGDDRALVDAPNPLFAGRDHLIKAVADDLRALRAAKRPLNNLTRVAYGAPGAGKSEILVQMAAEFSRWVEGDSRVLPVWANAASLTDPGVLGTAVYEAAKERPDRNKTRLAGVEAGASVGVAKASLSFERGVRQPAAPLWQIAHAINRDCHNPTILLLVDEAQAELEDALVAHGPKWVRLMHKGEMAGLKILPVYGGLGDTLQKLADAGVSRPSASRVHLLEPLDRDDARKMCETGLCALTGTSDPMTLGRWARRIVDKADGWPMHLANCMIAARDRRKAHMNRRFGDADFAGAMRRAAALRADYYDSRLEACPELDPDHYEAWGRLFAGGAMANAARVAGALRLSKPEAEVLLDKALRAGLVERTKLQLFKSPIPSLARHAIAAGRAHALCQNGPPAPDLGR